MCLKNGGITKEKVMNDLEQLIVEYLKEVEQGLKLIDQKIGRRDILAAWRQKLLPRKGVLQDGIEYELHGIGCCLIFPDHMVDFDFAPGGRSDGFDLWRLGLYVRQFVTKQ